MKKNGKMEIEKIIYVSNLKMNITPKNFHSNPIFHALRSKYSGNLSPIKGMKKNGKMEIEKIIYVCNLKMNIIPKNFHSNPIFQALRSKYSGNIKSY